MDGDPGLDVVVNRNMLSLLPFLPRAVLLPERALLSPLAVELPIPPPGLTALCMRRTASGRDIFVAGGELDK